MKKTWLALSALCSLALGPRAATACGASPPAEWKLLGVLPPAGQAVPTDGVLVVRRQVLEPVGVGNLAAAEVVVTVRDMANVEIPGTADIWYDFVDGWSLAWKPKASLPPSTTLSIEATVGAPSSAPAATDGLKISATIQTAAGPAPALHLSGDLAVSYEAYDRPTVLACPGFPCGGGTCPPGAPVRSLRARVTIPAVTGGFAPTGYNAWLWLTDEVPHVLPDGPSTGGNLNLGGIEPIIDGTKPTVAFRDLPAETEDYAPCFAVRVFDPAGHYEDRSTCLPKLNIAAKLAELDTDDNRIHAAAGGAGGCSVAGPSDDTRAVLILLLAVFAVARILAARASRRIG